VAAIAVPLLERTTQPYMRGFRYLQSVEFDRTVAPRFAQVRLDPRMIAGRMERFVEKLGWLERAPIKLLARSARGTVGFCEVLCVSTVMQLGMALPMAYYFHRATVMGIPANALAVPLTQLLMPAAVLAVVVAYVSLALAKVPAWLAAFGAAWNHQDGARPRRIRDRRSSCGHAGNIDHSAGRRRARFYLDGSSVSPQLANLR
jgi:competence protein ComEC